MSHISRRVFHRLVLMSVGDGLLSRDRLLLASPASATAPLQPLAAQIKRLITALESIGEPLPKNDVAALTSAFGSTNEDSGVEEIQRILEPHVLLNVVINPESRVSATRGKAEAQLIEQGWRSFLVKVINQSADNSSFKIQSPQGRPTGRRSDEAITGVHDFTNGAVDIVEARDRWIAINNWDSPPLQPGLSGLEIEYRIVQIYSRDAGQREATLRADACGRAGPRVSQFDSHSFQLQPHARSYLAHTRRGWRAHYCVAGDYGFAQPSLSGAGKARAPRSVDTVVFADVSNVLHISVRRRCSPKRCSTYRFKDECGSLGSKRLKRTFELRGILMRTIPTVVRASIAIWNADVSELFDHWQINLTATAISRDGQCTES